MSKHKRFAAPVEPVPSVADTISLGILSDTKFVEVFNRLLHESMPIAAAHAILVLQNEFKVHQNNFETLRHKLIAKYGETDADGNLVMNEAKTEYKMVNMESFHKEFVELMNIRVPVTKIPMSFLGDLKLKPADLNLLLNVIVKV